MRLNARRPPAQVSAPRTDETFTGRLTTIRHQRQRRLASSLARYLAWALCLVLLGFLVLGSLYEAVRGA